MAPSIKSYQPVAHVAAKATAPIAMATAACVGSMIGSAEFGFKGLPDDAPSRHSP